MSFDINDWRDLVGDEICDVWPIVADSVARLKGHLMGGTAVALHLRHRKSFDLDYITGSSFSGLRLVDRIRRFADQVDVILAETDSCFVKINDVLVQIFRDPARGDVPTGHVATIGKHLNVSGLRVGSLQDLFAAKLDVILYRPKLRDYIDIAALDQQSGYVIEDGLKFHQLRYGTTPHSPTLDRIINLLEEPGTLSRDRIFGFQEEDILSYLKSRVPSIRAHLSTQRMSNSKTT